MSLKLGISSMSLGRAWVHKLLPKLDQAALHNITGIEVFWEDIEYLAREQSNPSSIDDPSSDSLLTAARTVRSLLNERNLTAICLQPFMHYEGLKDRKEHQRRIDKMKLWFKVAHILRTDIIQVPASFLSEDEITGDLDDVVADLREIADLGAQESPQLRIAYENLGWSTYFDTWQKVYDVVERVDKPNFGICLDTFNIAGRVYGDPTVAGGKTPNAEEDMQKSLQEMVKRVNPRKIFLVEVVDAERMRDPLIQGHAFHVEGQPPRMSWSRNARILPFEEPGYLPVMDVLRAIVEGVGYRGWISMELFSRTLINPDDDVPKEHARRAATSWKKMENEFRGWKMAGHSLPSSRIAK